MTIRELTVKEGPCERFGQSLVAVPEKGILLLFGGRFSDFCFDDVWSYNVATATWTLLSFASEGSVSPPPRSWHSAHYYEKSLLIFGGWGDNSKVLGDVWEFSLATNTWKCLSGVVCGVEDEVKRFDDSPEVRTCHQAVVWQGALYVYGGVALHNLVAPPDLWKFEIQSRLWSIVKALGLPPGPRVSAASALVGDSWVFHGGLASFPAIGGTPTSDIYHFDFPTSTWHRKTELCLIGRASAVAHSLDVQQLDRPRIPRYGKYVDCHIICC